MTYQKFKQKEDKEKENENKCNCIGCEMGERCICGKRYCGGNH